MPSSNNILKAKGEHEKHIRRQHILNSAEKVLIENGLDKFNISAVAKAAQLAQGTLYLYFKKKEDIIAQLTLRSRAALLQSFHQGIEGVEDPIQQIKNLLIVNYEFYRDNRLYHDLASFYELTAKAEEPPELQQASQNIMAFVVSVLSRAQAQGRIKESLNITECTYMLWGTCTGMVQLIDIKGPRIAQDLGREVEEVYKSYVEFFVESMRA